MEYYIAEIKKELLPFVTAWIELESIMLCEISQVAKDKYHMISPICGISSTKHTREQNRTRDLEIKNKLDSDQKGVVWGYQGKDGEGSSQGTCKKDPWTRTVVGRIDCGRGCEQGRGEQWGKNGDNCKQQ